MLGKNKSKQQHNRRALDQFDTLISNKTMMVGDIQFSGGLYIDGRVRGKVCAEENSDAVLRVSDVGEIIGDVIAPHVIINGSVNGDVYASRHLELAAKASINGNVYYNLLEMAMGAEVNGSLIHQKEPLQGLLDHQPGKRGQAEQADEARSGDAVQDQEAAPDQAKANS